MLWARRSTSASSRPEVGSSSSRSRRRLDDGPGELDHAGLADGE